MTILADICKCAQIYIDRQLFTTGLQETGIRLHVFADGSTKAYGAVVFLSSLVESIVLMAKRRVAPLKKTTLPRLEMMVAVIAAKLVKFWLTPRD